MNISNVMNRAADGVDQRRASAHEVLAICQGFDLPQVNAVMDNRVLVSEQHRGDQSLALRLLLALDHAVEAADRVCFQTGHGAAFVQDEDHFSQILFH